MQILENKRQYYQSEAGLINIDPYSTNPNQGGKPPGPPVRYLYSPNPNPNPGGKPPGPPVRYLNLPNPNLKNMNIYKH